MSRKLDIYTAPIDKLVRREIRCLIDDYNHKVHLCEICYGVDGKCQDGYENYNCCMQLCWKNRKMALNKGVIRLLEKALKENKK